MLKKTNSTRSVDENVEKEIVRVVKRDESHMYLEGSNTV